MSNRNVVIDYMRAGALALIILAHVSAPFTIMEFRCFDVVMLVFLSGFSYRLSAENRKRTYKKYIWGRIKKLLFPTWIILTLIFGCVFFISKSAEPIGIVKMIESYLLYDGIGYVWFVRVTLLLAIVSPILLGLSKKIHNNELYFVVVLIIWYILYYLMLLIYNMNMFPHWINLFYYLYPIYIMGYGSIYFLGIHYNNLSQVLKRGIFLITVFIIVFFKFFANASIGEDKYPPGMLYIAYGIMWSIGVYEILNRLHLKKCPELVRWISQNSFTVYLVHIIPTLMLKYWNASIIKLAHTNFVTEYVYLVGTTIILIILWNIGKSELKKFYNGRKK